MMPRTKHTTSNRELARFIKHSYANAPAVKKIFDNSGLKPTDIKRIADLERVPVTSKDRVAELQRESPPFGGFLAVNLRRAQRIFQSPGPLYEPRGAEKSLDRTGAQVFRMAGFKRGDIVLNTLSYHLSPGGWHLIGRTSLELFDPQSDHPFLFSPGDEVIVPTLTYIAAVNAIAYTGATPVFVDSLSDTWQMDPADVRRKLTPRTKGIIINSPCNPTGAVLPDGSYTATLNGQNVKDAAGLPLARRTARSICCSTFCSIA